MSIKSIAKGIGYVIFGVCAMAFGYWIGFIGYVSSRGLYYDVVTTRPIGGIIAILSGIGCLILGIALMLGTEEKQEKEKQELADKYSK